MSCKQHNYQYFLMSVVPNLLRQCTFCGNLQAQVTGIESGQPIWIDTTMVDLFGSKVYIITGNKFSFDMAKAYLAEDYHISPETFVPLLTIEDFVEFQQICVDGGRPCMVLNPVDWFENPFITEWYFASALSSNIGGMLLRPVKEGYV